LTFLATMLGEAAVWRPDKPTPTAEQVMADPRYEMYVADWPRPGDFGLIAELDGPVGAAWYRTYTETSHGHGFIAHDIPELTIAVVASHRQLAIGRTLLTGLVDASVAQGYPAISLSVAENNPARALYESTGFEHVTKHGWTWTMIRHAGPPN
jgi:ribosomal protein S18 acetylase RimI-like enzyme